MSHSDTVIAIQFLQQAVVAEAGWALNGVRFGGFNPCGFLSNPQNTDYCFSW